MKERTLDMKTETIGGITKRLNNGLDIPLLGIGTFRDPGDEAARQAVAAALQFGYRHIDTAHAYYDEVGVGQGIIDSGVPREQIWLTSKLWTNEYGEGKTSRAIDAMLDRLQVDYLDLLYVHQPVGDWKGAWRDMEKAVRDGKVRSLGISNFDRPMSLYDEAMRWAEIKPVALQTECQPYAQREELAKRLKADNVLLEAWFPLGGAGGHRSVTSGPIIDKIARNHGKTPTQIVLRWHIQEGHSAIPGSINPEHIAENFNIFDFELSPEDMALIRSLNREKRFY